MPKNRRNPPNGSALLPWYTDGLRFECLPDCGSCCTNHDDYAYVYLNSGEPERLAEFLDLGPEAFNERYTAVVERHIVLKTELPDCPFLSDNRCSVYPVRPVQCRSFPFWDENLLNPEHWKRLREFCPGIDRGPLLSLPVIEEQRKSRKR